MPDFSNFECDKCGAKAVTIASLFAGDVPPLPDGWISIKMNAEKVEMIYPPRHAELCSANCLRSWFMDFDYLAKEEITVAS